MGTINEWEYRRESGQTGYSLWWGGFMLSERETDEKSLDQLQDLHEMQLEELNHPRYVKDLQEVERQRKRLDSAQEALVREVEIFRLSGELNGVCDYCQEGSEAHTP